MVKKLTKHGNSLALLIDKPVLDLLKIDGDTFLEVTTDGRSLIVSPAATNKRRAKFEAAVKDTLKKYPRMLKRLAQ